MTDDTHQRQTVLQELRYLDRQGAPHDMGANIGSDVLDVLEAFLVRFIVYPNKHTRRAHVLWIVHCWLMNCWYFTPRLLFVSPLPDCGKGTAFRVTKTLVPRAETVGDMSVAAFYSIIDETVEEYGARPTILYDQIDKIFGPKSSGAKSDLYSLMIDIGFDRSATRRRKIGKRSVRFEPFCALAMTGAMSLFDVPPEVRSRSVVIHMQKKTPPERLGRRVEMLEADAAPVRDLIQAWTGWLLASHIINPIGHHAANGGYLPDIPEEISGRDADKWEPLLALAELAGGHWTADTRVTAVTAVTALSSLAVPSRGEQLLWAIEDAFNAHDGDVLYTEHLLRVLASADKMWSSLTPITLARQLSDFEVGPKTQRVGGKIAKGYRREYFTDVWVTYPRPQEDEDEDTDPLDPLQPLQPLRPEQSDD
jgi:Protein of unknown function (DUF3631)